MKTYPILSPTAMSQSILENQNKKVSLSLLNLSGIRFVKRTRIWSLLKWFSKLLQDQKS